MTVGGALDWARGILANAGIFERRTVGELLLAHAVGKSRSWVLLNRNRRLLGGGLQEFQALVIRCAAGTPARYLTGSVEFFGLDLKIESGVYIPKCETELLVEAALEFLEAPRRPDLTWGESRSRSVIHEIGTGSGAIAISIAKHAPCAAIAASDISAFALSIARANAGLNGVSRRINFCQGDLQAPLAGIPDLVVANLPYVGNDEFPDLPRQVRAQPRSSLISQGCGLDHIERLLKDLVIKPGGRIMLEIGYSQADGVRAVCAESPKLRYERTINDLAGLDRIAVIAST